MAEAQARDHGQVQQQCKPRLIRDVIAIQQA